MRQDLIILHRTAALEGDPPGAQRISIDEFKQWIKRGAVWGHLFAHPTVLCRTYRLGVVSRPFFFFFLTKILARDRCLWKDQSGHEWEVTWGGLLGLFFRMLGAWARRPFLLAGVRRELERCSGASPQPGPLRLERTPVYLRTDMSFGVASGGSLGHIAGVLDHLGLFGGKPLFLTSDDIPTVRKDIETRVIPPRSDFFDLKDMPAFDYNRTFFDEASRLLSGREISFVYQRYGLNNMSGLGLSRLFRVPLVLEYNGSEIWVARHWGDEPMRYTALSERIEMENLRGAQVVAVVSRPLRDELVGRGIDGGKIVVVPNGVDCERYSPGIQGGAVLRKWGLEGKKVIGFIGTFGRWHGAEVLAEAFGKLLREWPGYGEKVRLLLVGEGATLPLVREILGRYGAEGQCVLTGAVPQAEGPAHLAACDILVAPHVPNPDGTPFFGSPTKLFEYMAMGKAVVASDLDQIGEVLEQDRTAVLVRPGDPAGLADALRALLEDEPRRRRLGAAAREEALAKHTWTEHTRRIIEKLKERCP